MYVNRAPVCTVKCLKIAERLGHFQHAERVRRVRHREVALGWRRDDDEDPVVRSALVKLTGRVKISRSVAQHRRAAFLHRDAVTDIAENRVQHRIIRRNVREEREVVALPELIEELVETV
jgi:hypothetical protein